eukprot:5492556-Pyramimonas_sp.AAC.1
MYAEYSSPRPIGSLLLLHEEHVYCHFTTWGECHVSSTSPSPSPCSSPGGRTVHKQACTPCVASSLAVSLGAPACRERAREESSLLSGRRVHYCQGGEFTTAREE